TAVASVMFLLAIIPAGAQRLPSIVPPGWTQAQADPETKTRRFVSSDGKAWLQTKQTDADPSALNQDMDDVAYRDGEKITYQTGSGLDRSVRLLGRSNLLPQKQSGLWRHTLASH